MSQINVCFIFQSGRRHPFYQLSSKVGDKLSGSERVVPSMHYVKGERSNLFLFSSMLLLKSLLQPNPKRKPLMDSHKHEQDSIFTTVIQFNKTLKTVDMGTHHLAACLSLKKRKAKWYKIYRTWNSLLLSKTYGFKNN